MPKTMNYPMKVSVGLKGPHISNVSDMSTTDPKYIEACEMEKKLKTYLEAFPDYPVDYVDVEISWEDIDD